MTKKQAIALFGTSHANMAKALGVSRVRITQWPDQLTDKQADRVRGAALRLGIPLTSLGADRPTPTSD